VKSCKYIVGNSDALRTVMSDIQNAMREHGALNVEWKVPRSRSLSQNALFHVWCREFADSFNRRSKSDEYTPDDIKLILKHKFLGYESKVVGKTEIKDQLKSTSKVDKGEMFQFMERIWDWGIQVNVLLSCPEDSELQKLRESQHEV